MRNKIYILMLFVVFSAGAFAAENGKTIDEIRFDFYGDTICLKGLNASFVDFEGSLSTEKIQQFYNSMNTAGYEPVVAALQNYRTQHKPDDWLYYQLVRKMAQSISAKEVNYHRYTLYKWYFLGKTGYDASLNIAGDQLLFYVQCDENIYDIPRHMKNGKQYVCLNYHDYGSIDFARTKFRQVDINIPEAQHGFSYKLTGLPGFNPGDYREKDIEFSYQDLNYKFKIKFSPNVKNIFANYPVADYQLYFNMPLSSETYNSLVPQLKENIRGMGVRQGVDYLMRFTRYSFLYQPDGEHFGKEKRLSAEQTLLYESSDCEDRAALFFYLVKEIYRLPMIVLAYPEHVTIAVKFDKPIGTPIIYNGQQYTICEPTPQRDDAPLGKISRELSKKSYEVAVVYNPE